jgi:hypothetical protein
MKDIGQTQIQCGVELAREGVIANNSDHSALRATQYPTVHAMQVAKVPHAISITANCIDQPFSVAQLLKS